MLPSLGKVEVNRMHTIRPFARPFALMLLALSPSLACADVFRYKDGRVVSGTLRGDPKEQTIDGVTETVYTVMLEPGTFVMIFESELERNGHDRLSEAEQNYEATAIDKPQTAEAHYELAAEVSKDLLRDLAKAHYRRILDMDPDNQFARAGADYKKDDSGRWVKKEEIYAGQRGKVFVNGKWRFPESIAVEQAEEEAAQEINPIKKELSRFHQLAAFGRNDRLRSEGIAGIQSINDPLAVPLIAAYLLETFKPAPVNVRLLYVRWLARFENPLVAQTLAQASINDPEPQVRNACLSALRSFGANAAVPLYIGQLSSDDNARINIAAQGLAQFNPPQAVLPLIHALNTEHLVDVGGGGDTYSMQGGMTLGGNNKKVKRVFQNASVYATLTQITGQNYNYDEALWLAWYARLRAAPANDLRRDP